MAAYLLHEVFKARVLANLKTPLEIGETLPDVELNTPARLGLTR
jgi:hypothetical protein